MIEFPVLPYPWQQQVWQQYLGLLASERMPHAIMLAGPKGIGKAHVALALAHYVLCASPVMGVPCGKCRGCQLNQAATHPDLLEVAPEEDSKTIKVDQIRTLTESMSKTAQQGGFKVVVLQPAEAMNANAANALLKTLEEPANKTLLILISHAPFSVLPTIRSRCQLKMLPMPAREQVLHWITPLLGGSQVAPELLIDLARGAPLTALSLLKDDTLEQREQWQVQLARLSQGGISAVELAAQWHTGDITALLEWLSALLHSVARLQHGHEDAVVARLPADFKVSLESLRSDVLQRYLEKLLHIKRLWNSGANPNKQLMLEELLMDWSALLRSGQNAAAGGGKLSGHR